MTPILTDYELFEQSSDSNRRLLCEEELILEVTEAVSAVMQEEGITKAQLARRMGRTKGFITQLLSGSRNLTLRTLAGVADALESRVTITVSKDRHRMSASDESPYSRVFDLEPLDTSLWNQEPIERDLPTNPPLQDSVDEMYMEAAA